MKIISSTQLKELDKYTIAKEPVASIDLMERAAEELTRAITPASVPPNSFLYCWSIISC